jgi:dephospho-CoA kinase
VLIEVFADERTRYDRTLARVKSDPNAHGDVKSFEYFQEKEKGQFRTDDDPSKMQLLECIQMATYRINNNGSIEELHDQADKLLAKLEAPQDKTLLA